MAIKLSMQQMALFGRTQVKYKDNQVCSLYSLYENGWWGTCIFSYYITLVKRKNYTKNEFACICRPFTTSVPREALEREVNAIAEKQWEKYKNILDKKDYVL